MKTPGGDRKDAAFFILSNGKTIMIHSFPALRTAIATLALATLLPLPGLAQDSSAAECDEASGRCTASVRLVAEDGKGFGTIGLQIDKNGNAPVLFAATPLGIAVHPGVRIITQPGAQELPLAVDACFPDGCRATLELGAEQLAGLTAAETLSLQFIPFSSTETVSADLPAAGILTALRDAGVTLP